jgi:hypothetical protein
VSDKYSDYEKAAGGLDFDEPLRERAASIGSKVAERGPEALLDEVENLLPDAWRDQVVSFPMTAVLVGVGIGIFLGMKKSDEVIAAGTALITSAATQNFSSVVGSMKA